MRVHGAGGRGDTEESGGGLMDGWELPNIGHVSIKIGCLTELVECDECSFFAFEITFDGVPQGELCIVPIDGLD